MKRNLYLGLVLVSLLLSKVSVCQIPYLVKDINDARDAYPQNSRSAKNIEDNQPFAVLNGRAYFGVTINGGWQLWRSNGTAAGTQLVKVISIGGSKVPIYDITTCGNQLFFIADDGVNGVGLWKSDGTAAGTVLVKGNHATTS